MLAIGFNTELDFSNVDELHFDEIMDLCLFASENLLKAYAIAVYRQLSDKHHWEMGLGTFDDDTCCICVKKFGKYQVECNGNFYNEYVDDTMVSIRDAWPTFFYAEYRVSVDGSDVALDPISECHSVKQKYCVSCTPQISRECIAELAKVIDDKAEELVKGLAGIR